MQYMMLIVIASLGYLVITQGAPMEQNTFSPKPAAVAKPCPYERKEDLIHQVIMIIKNFDHHWIFFEHLWDRMSAKEVLLKLPIENLRTTLQNYCEKGHPLWRTRMNVSIKRMRSCFEDAEYDGEIRSKVFIVLFGNYMCDHQEQISNSIVAGHGHCMQTRYINETKCEDSPFERFDSMPSNSSEKSRACAGLAASQKHLECINRLAPECPQVPDLTDYLLKQLPEMESCNASSGYLMTTQGAPIEKEQSIPGPSLDPNQR